jgi:hypothetical protein
MPDQGESMTHEKKLSDCPSSGREPYVWRAEGPEDLPRVHAGLIGSGLRPGEPAYYLLYAPLRRAETVPFGIEVGQGSHALAITPDRFLFSRDPHRDGQTPQIHSIPLEKILKLDVGDDLLLGWFSIAFSGKEGVRRLAFFFTATGMDHVLAAMRAYRAATVSGGMSPEGCGNSSPWADLWARTNEAQAGLLKPLLLAGERPVRVLRSSEVWKKDGSGRRPVCLSTEGILSETTGGIIHIVEEAPLRPRMLSFGVNMAIIPKGVPIEETIGRHPLDGGLRMLRMKIGTLPAALNHCVVYDRVSEDPADGTVSGMQVGVS